MKMRALFFPLLVGSLCWSCSDLPISGLGAGEELRQISRLKIGAYTRHRLIVLIVDDAPTEEARRMREQLAEGFLGWIDDFRYGACGYGSDFAQDFPMDVRLLLIPSSSP